ncbi:MAG: hypothetical protein KGI71_04330 [Patescibacteria group bacterium]|nr:hypothetical protein [Patescibacteria group bacterium]
MLEPVRLIPTKPDVELAAEFKARIVEAYKPILTLLDEVEAAGFQAHINTSKGALGKQVITQLTIVKVY